MECKCYVKNLSEHERFSVRRGAHERRCPVFRESRDPVDRVHDEITRSLNLIQDKEA
jgi:hypothetical protein